MKILPLLVTALVAATPLFGAGELSGRRAPGFALPDSRVQYHDLADYRGKVVLIDFIQTSCPNCQKLAAVLEKMKEKYKDRIQVLTITNPPDNVNTVATFVRDHKVSSPVLFDCGQMTAIYLKVSPQRPSIHLPHLFLVDQNGQIRNDFSHSDATKDVFDGPGLQKELDKMLADSAPKPANKK